jgi:hypothetical protein
MVHCLSRLEAGTSLPLQRKLLTQFLNPVFDVRPSIVSPPYRQRLEMERQVSEQNLEPVAWHLRQEFATSLRPTFDPMADKGQATS